MHVRPPVVSNRFLTEGPGVAYAHPSIAVPAQLLHRVPAGPVRSYHLVQFPILHDPVFVVGAIFVCAAPVFLAQVTLFPDQAACFV